MMRRISFAGTVGLLTIGLTWPGAAAQAGRRSRADVARVVTRASATTTARIVGPEAPPVAGETPFTTSPPGAWAQHDPADSVYRVAREALNRGDYQAAASRFGRIAESYPRSTYAADALYWEAYAFYRMGNSDNLRAALSALDLQRRSYPKAATRGDGEALAVRIQGELARTGDASAAERVTEAARAAREAAEAGATLARAEQEQARGAQTSASAARAALEAERARAEAQGAGSAQDKLPAQCAQDPNAEVRVAALNALLQMDGERALPVLKDVLQRRDPCSAPLRRKAVFLVAEGRSAEAEDVLVSVARTDPDPEVRKQAVFWLSQVPTEKAVSALQDILKTSSDRDLQEQALFALSQQNSPRAGAILRDYAERSDVPEDLKERAVFWIGQHGKPDDVGYLKQLFDRSTTPALKEKILFAVSQSGGPEAGSWLLTVAGDTKQSMDVRKKALFWAGQAGVPIGDLTSLYDRTTDPALKDQLIFVLSQRSEPAAVDKLIDIARNEKDQDLRKKAIFWLGQSDDPRVVKVLQDIIGHE